MLKINKVSCNTLFFVWMSFCTLALSWVYALCAQVAIPLFPVPISLMPLPVFFAVYRFGAPAVFAFILYLVQGALGAPFFAHGQGGFGVICGPRGGYLFGMVVGAFFLLWAKRQVVKAFWSTAFVFLIAEIIMFAVGLLQLAFFVPTNMLLATGFYPFILGDLFKIFVLTGLVRAKN